MFKSQDLDGGEITVSHCCWVSLYMRGCCNNEESRWFRPWVVSPLFLGWVVSPLGGSFRPWVVSPWVVSPNKAQYKAHTDIQIDKLDGGREGEMGGWIDGWIIDIIRPIRTDRQNGWMDEWMNEWFNGCMNEWFNGWMNEWMNIL